MQSKSQLDAPDAHGVGNTLIESCKVRSVFTPQDPVTAQWISDALGPKTEVHQQTTYTGHRLAPWLGHVMVADQETSRPLLDAAEICKLPASDMILLVAGFPPIRARRLKYYERPDLAARASLPALPLPAAGPYPYRPRQHVNPWAGRVSAVPAAGAGTPPAKPDQPARPSTARAGSSIPLAGPVLESSPAADALATQQPSPHEAAIQGELDLLVSEEELKRRQGLDEMERLHAGRRHTVQRRIPL